MNSVVECSAECAFCGGLRAFSRVPEMLCVSGDVALICMTVTMPMAKPSIPDRDMPAQNNGLNTCLKTTGKGTGDTHDQARECARLRFDDGLIVFGGF